jgi:DNA-binding response OmpR family regulator
MLELGDLQINTLEKTVMANGQWLDLTRKEYDLLLFLVTNKNRVISKNAIAEHISGEEAEAFDSYDFLYAHIKNLKKKLAAAGSPDYIKTMYGMGYKFEIHA